MNTEEQAEKKISLKNCSVYPNKISFMGGDFYRLKWLRVDNFLSVTVLILLNPVKNRKV